MDPTFSTGLSALKKAAVEDDDDDDGPRGKKRGRPKGEQKKLGRLKKRKEDDSD